MPLRLNVTADDDIREQILTLIREQVRPLIYEAVKDAVSPEFVREMIEKEVKAQVKIEDAYSFRESIKKEIVNGQAYLESYKLLPEEGRKEAKELIEREMKRWVEAAGRKEIAAIVKDILGKAVVA